MTKPEDLSYMQLKKWLRERGASKEEVDNALGKSALMELVTTCRLALDVTLTVTVTVKYVRCPSTRVVKFERSTMTMTGA